jgi:hypothetical protein
MSNTDCPICLEAVTNPVYMNCQHKVCGTCWPNVRITQSCCPLCRKPFVCNSILNHYFERSHIAPITCEEIIVLMLLLALVFVISSIMFIEETCMCIHFQPGELTKTTYNFFGGSITRSRPSFCITYC